MTRFGVKSQGSQKAVNYEGEPAFKLQPKEELYAIACTSSLQPTFYVPKTDDIIGRVRELVKKVPHDFTAKLAIYSRDKMYFRSVPLVLVTELAKVHSGDNLIKKTVERVVQRADEITELLAYYEKANPKQGIKKLNKLSNQIKKGLAKSFTRFDEYQFGKYDRDLAVSLKDALFLVHPKPKDKAQEELFKKIVDGTLATPFTWETELSAKGNNKETWENLITSKKLPYMALLRNLRNIAKAGVSDEHMEAVFSTLTNDGLIRKARQFPFRFYSAWVEAQEAFGFKKNRLRETLETAINKSIEFMPFNEKDRIVVANDTSGSMVTKISAKSSIELWQVGIVLSGLIAKKVAQTITCGFDSNFYLVKNQTGNILDSASAFRSGGSTNGFLVPRYFKQQKIVADKFYIFTDMQLWNSTGDFFGRDNSSFSTEWVEYTKLVNPEAKLYIFNLAPYETSPISTLHKNVYFICGWNEKIFGVLDAIENGSTAIKEIEKIEI